MRKWLPALMIAHQAKHDDAGTAWLVGKLSGSRINYPYGGRIFKI